MFYKFFSPGNIVEWMASHIEALLWVTEQQNFLQCDESCTFANIPKAETLSILSTKSSCSIDDSSKKFRIISLKSFQILERKELLCKYWSLLFKYVFPPTIFKYTTEEHAIKWYVGRKILTNKLCSLSPQHVFVGGTAAPPWLLGLPNRNPQQHQESGFKETISKKKGHIVQSLGLGPE